ncbi:MAG: hypothetical protein ACK5LE_00100 [Alphaproteobacteria bacterium]
MCTALIMGIAQLGLGLASSYNQYRAQKKQYEAQEKQAKEQKAQIEQIQAIEAVGDDREARAQAAAVRASSGAAGVELSGSHADYLSQMGQDFTLSEKQNDLQNQQILNQKDYQIQNAQNQAGNAGNILGYNIVGQILNGAGSLV